MRKSYELYSVESRKGGVGKTTMALNLSKALIEKGYKVLYLDCDISGTPIPDATGHSFYWSKYANIMYDKIGRPANLLKIYNDDFLTEQVVGNKIIDGFQIDDNKINIIGSDIYDEHRRLIVDPRNLMDEISSYWLLEMIKQVAEAFSGSSDRKSAIVIDNSPGYVGLAKSIRDWMTSIGPKYSHFLLVSSLDEQDFSSVVSSAEEIYNLMQSKWDMAKGKNMLISDDNNSTDKSLQQFFYSLRRGSAYPSLDLESISVTSYLGIVFNKTPESLAIDNVMYDISDIDSETRKMLVDKLIPRNKNGFPIQAVGYNTLVSEQFISSRIGVSGDGNGKTTLSQEDALQKSVSYAESLNGDYDKILVLKRLANSYSSILSHLSKEGYVGLSQAFRYMYKPFDSLRALPIIRFPFIKAIIEVAGEWQAHNLDDGFERLFELERGLLADSISRCHTETYSNYLYSMLDYLHEQSRYHLKKHNYSRIISTSFLIRVFCNNLRDNCEGDFRAYLMKEYNDTSSEMHPNNFELILDEMISYLRYYGRVSLADFNSMPFRLTESVQSAYKKMCYALLRMIDGIPDYCLLLTALQKTLRGNYPRNVNADLISYMEDVIVNKKYDIDCR